MKKSEAKRKSSSIAGKLYRMFVGRMFLTLFWTDILFALCVTAGFICYQEVQYFGNVSKDISIDISVIDTSVRVGEKGEKRIILELSPAAAESAEPSEPESPSEPVELDITLTVQFAKGVGLIILGVEGLCLLIAVCFDYFRIKGKLRPLSEIAENAENITNMALDTSKFQNLEYAIEHVRPDSPTAHVVTNDRDLQGIETALNSLIDRMRESARQQSRFVSDASHELRTPIAVIKGYVDMLDRWGKEDKQILEEAISAIKHESDHMNKLVEQLLFLARGDSGRQQMTFEKFSLSDMLREVYEESKMIDEKHHYEYIEDAADILAYGDISMLKQSVRILVDNAAKYTNEGDTITLKVGVSRDFHPFVSVQDNGVGMSSHDAAHIFERFYRSDTARNSQTGGTGLGLSIAKWIIDRHNGSIEVVSREEIGTRFTILLNTPQQTA